jgi:hypothetical protein
MASKYLGLWKGENLHEFAGGIIRPRPFNLVGMDNFLDLRLILQVVNTGLEVSAS